MLIYKKLDRKEALIRQKELQNVCKLWLGTEGTYSLENWNDFCKYCDIFVCINNNLVVGILLASLSSTYQCEQMLECMEEYNLLPNKTIHIMMFAVNPSHRKIGIGTNLFEMLYTKSDYNAKYYILAMRQMNHIAKTFYLKQGFIESNFKYDASYENPVDNQIFLIKEKSD